MHRSGPDNWDLIGEAYNSYCEHIAPSVRALKIFDITQVTTTEALQFRHAVLGPG